LSGLTEPSRNGGNLCAFAARLPEDRRFQVAFGGTLAEIAETISVWSQDGMRALSLFNCSLSRQFRRDVGCDLNGIHLSP